MSGPRIGELFAGYGGLGLGVRAWLGGRVSWVSDFDTGPNKILAHRFPGVPNHGDITKIDWSAVEPVEVLTGGFPCTDLSKAGNRAGLRPGTRSGLWQHMAHGIDQLRPALVVAENVRGLLSGEADSDLEPCALCLGDRRDCTMRALGVVLADLAERGYDAQWTSLRASDIGAPHERERVFLVAAPADSDLLAPGLLPGGLGGHPRQERHAGTAHHRAPGGGPALPAPRPLHSGVDSWGEYAPLVADWERTTGHPAPHIDADLPVIQEWMMGLPAGWVTDVPGLTRHEALKALGNGVVPQQATAALSTLLAWEVAA